MTFRRDLGPVLALFMAERRGLMTGGVALAAATLLAGIALLGLSGWFITATALAGLSATAALTFDVFAPSAGIRFLALARTGARYGERLVTHDATLRILAALRERLFRGWAEPEAARSLLVRPAKLLFRLTADIDALDSLYLRLLVPAGAAFAAALAMAVAFGLMHAWLGLALAGWLLLVGFGLPLLAARWAVPWARRRSHALEALRARAIALVAGQTELVMAGRLDAQLAATRAADRRLMAAEDRLNRIETGTSAGFGIATAATLAGTLLGVAALAEAGTIGAPVAALGLLVALGSVEPFAGLRRGAIELGRTRLAARRLAPRLSPAPAAASPSRPDATCAVRFAAVSAVYPGAEPPVFQDLSLTIGRGERVAVIGPSGAGKSTLLALIAGEMTPASGTVEAIDSTLLTQRTELFHDSLRENLALADPAADDVRLWDALDAAGLGPDLRAAGRGLDARLGEGGLGLSGGQGRRLALARLLLRASPLWLLDEPTEGLDRETAGDVLERLAERLGGHSLVVVTHLRREAALADRLLILEMGCIVASPQRGESGFDAALAALRPD
ncbi:MAG: thiol reductant ABC exporter subunit CydC [Rhizobiales bacterium]|nr:thiol reductant ABC exporter subunit CydC [Hyphomicrobiales bacterium]